LSGRLEDRGRSGSRGSELTKQFWEGRSRPSIARSRRRSPRVAVARPRWDILTAAQGQVRPAVIGLRKRLAVFGSSRPPSQLRSTARCQPPHAGIDETYVAVGKPALALFGTTNPGRWGGLHCRSSSHDPATGRTIPPCSDAAGRDRDLMVGRSRRRVTNPSP